MLMIGHFLSFLNHEKPSWNCDPLRKMILICLFGLNDVTRGETIHLNSQKLPIVPPGFSQSSCSRCLRLKMGACHVFVPPSLVNIVRTSPNLVLISLLRSACGNTLSALYFHIKFSSSDSFSCVFACVPPTFKWWIEMRVKGLLCRGPLTHLCRILLSLINVDDTIF